MAKRMSGRDLEPPNLAQVARVREEIQDPEYGRRPHQVSVIAGELQRILPGADRQEIEDWLSQADEA